MEPWNPAARFLTLEKMPMKALLYLVLGIFVLAMIIGLVFKIIGFLIVAALVAVAGLWIWRKISRAGGERPMP
jgi:hypothetical protein